MNGPTLVRSFPAEKSPASPTDAPGTPAERTSSSPEDSLSELDLSSCRAELMDPASWAETLSRFGRTMRLAVALTDTDGNLLGSCHNSQPLWSRVRNAAPGPGAACSFCLHPAVPCHAVPDALASGEIVCVQDQTGLAHAAIPLLLGNQRLGALIAGQVFAHYPQPLALQRVALRFGVSQQELWEMAVHQVPLSLSTLHLYAELLSSLGKAFLQQRYAAILDRKLLETIQRYRLMIEGSKDHALFTVDHKGYITSWNSGAERLLGYNEAEIRGSNYSVFFTPEDVRNAIPKREIERAEQNGRVEHEGWQVRKDGKRFWSETIMARLGESGVREYGSLLRDVTEQRQSLEAAMQAQKLESIGVLAGGIAHDFNNLLTSILGNVSLAVEGLPPAHPSRTLLQIAERSSLKAADLVAQLLAYAGKGNSVATRFDLSRLIEDILPLIETSIPKTVQMELNLPQGLPWMVGEATEMQQIVMNLVINGAEATASSGGTVWVSTGVTVLDSDDESHPDGIYLEVRDSGCGMDAITRRRIFDPFFTTKSTGRGLGLAAVSGIVRRLKGRMDVQSALGKGSTFRIVFPAVPAQAVEKAVPVQSDLPGTGLVLVVDDDPMVRGLACAVLQRHGYSVLVAENGEKAVSVFRSNADEIDAVLLDLTMPVMGGGTAFQLMNELRPDIPVIISSGYAEAEVREQFTSALAGVIQKPYSMSDLRKKIAAVLSHRKTGRMHLSAGGSDL
jgi:PAS domain S-box-containing protein